MANGGTVFYGFLLQLFYNAKIVGAAEFTYLVILSFWREVLAASLDVDRNDAAFCALCKLLCST